MTPDPAKRPLDIHANMVVPDIMAWAKGHGVVNIEPPAERITAAMRQETLTWGDKNAAIMRDINLRLEAMDRTGVEVNDAITAMMAAHPGRFAGRGEIPLHSPRLAIEEMTGCINELGFIGVQVSSTAGDMELGEKALWLV
jgi:predicted TIM-barrel fold metal-dependent hydrolase